MTKACSNCVFWVAAERSVNGQCRRFPPTHQHIALTFNEYWCGEHKPIVVDKKKKNA